MGLGSAKSPRSDMTPTQYREMRLAMDLTQAELADMLGVPREAISRRESGDQQITKEAQIAILALRTGLVKINK